MSDSPNPSNASNGSSPFSLAQLEQLQKQLTPTTTPSRTPATLEQPSVKPATPSALPGRWKKTTLEAFEEAVGGREQVVEILGSAKLDQRQQFFVELLTDPARERDSISAVARDAGLTVVQAVEVLRSAAHARSTALGLVRLATAVPAVADDLAAKSVDAKIECPQCFGAGYVTDGVTCAACNGKGLIFRGSDLDRQKIVLESTGILKKGPGMNVNVNQQVGIMQPGNFFSKYVKASDAAAYDVIDETSIINVEPDKDLP